MKPIVYYLISIVLLSSCANEHNQNVYVLIHGAWLDEKAWDEVNEILALHGEVITLNLPTHGSDTTNAKSVHLNDYVKSVEETIIAQNKKVILVGHSLAGMVISQVAENIPYKIERLVYVCAYLPQNGDNLSKLIQQDTKTKLGSVVEVSPDRYTAILKHDSLTSFFCTIAHSRTKKNWC